VERRLKCRYWTNGNHPRLILQPAKLEELWHSPHVVRFHNIITDQEIADIKSIAKPRVGFCLYFYLVNYVLFVPSAWSLRCGDAKSWNEL